MSFSFALCSEVFKTPIEETFRTVAALGFQGIEIAPFNIAESVEEVSAKRRREIRQAAEDVNLEILGLHWLLVSPSGLHLTTDDDGVRAKTINYLKALTHFCADLGGDFMVLGSPAQRNIAPKSDANAARARAIDALRQVGPTLSERGVRLLLEALHPNETNFLQTIEEVEALNVEIDHDQISYMLDCKAMSGMPDGIVGTIKKYGRTTGHFHANDPSGAGPGMGELAFAPVLDALSASGYKGWVSSEPFQYEPDSETVARTALQTLTAAQAG